MGLAKQKRVSDLMLGHCKFAAKQLGSMPGNLKKLLHSHPRRYLRRPHRVAAGFLKAFGLSIVEVRTFVCNACGALLGSKAALCHGRATAVGSKFGSFAVDFDA